MSQEIDIAQRCQPSLTLAESLRQYRHNNAEGFVAAYEYDGTRKAFNELRQQLADVSHELDLLRSAQKWIDVNDRLPREHEDCLVYYHEHSKFFSSLYYITQSSYYNDRFGIDQRVTHWMPLPAAPSAEVLS